jgi:hypothetical protein
MTRHRLLSLFVMLTLVAFQPAAWSKAYFAPAPEMIQSSPHIAVIEITGVERTETQGGHWTYSQKAHAKVHRNIKGQLAKTVTLYGGENFLCARVQYQPGHYLAFLTQDEKGFLHASNWHLSLRPLRLKGKLGKDYVEWYAPEGHVGQFSWLPLEDVIKEIKKTPGKEASVPPHGP